VAAALILLIPGVALIALIALITLITLITLAALAVLIALVACIPGGPRLLVATAVAAPAPAAVPLTLVGLLTLVSRPAGAVVALRREHLAALIRARNAVSALRAA